MRIQYKFLCIIPLLFLTMSCIANMEEEFQKNADIIRVKHLEYYGNLIEEYKRIAGHYPFEGGYDTPVYVAVASSKQQNEANEYFSHVPQGLTIISFKDWVAEVSKTLGRDIEEYYDPQYVRTDKWNFYLYACITLPFMFIHHFHFQSL